MAVFEIFFFFFLLSISSIFLSNVSANITYCGHKFCGVDGPPVRFPFRLIDSQLSSRCSYRTGFDLSCNNQKQTVLRLRSGNFIVRKIDYDTQFLSINDPDDCLPRRFLKKEFEINGSDPFKVYRMENYTFFNCSRDLTMYQISPISCLGNGNDNFVVFALPTRIVSNSNRWRPPLDSPSPSPSASPSSSSSSQCSVISTAMVPVSARSFPWPDRFSDLSGDIRLTWTEPDCSDCLDSGGVCGFQIGSATKIGCSVSPIGSNHGLPRGAKYGIIIGVGIPGLLCLIGLASYICGRVRNCGQRRRPYTDYTGSDTAGPVVVVMGFDGPTIESFPKTQLGESKRLPKPNDNTCPICLSEYQPKETLRTIPECNHYFHATCVDEWLKMNATCPLCRNSPETSSHVSPSSSVSSLVSSSVSSSSSLESS